MEKEKPIVTINLVGGLGNQMFMIFTTIAFARKNHLQFQFPSSIPHDVNGTATQRFPYWHTMFRTLDKYTVRNPYIDCQLMQIKEQGYHYNPLPQVSDHDDSADVNRKIVFVLNGYFQSPYYFMDYYKEIYDLLDITSMRNILRMIYDDEIPFKNTCSLHFRLGDYKHLAPYHPLLSTDYYVNAVEYLTTKCPNLTTVLYFCETEDHAQVEKMHLLSLRAKFPKMKWIRAERMLADWEQMILMSCCAHHVIANSSFSWWGAFLNIDDSKSKQVCYPDVWFGPALHYHNTKDLFPMDWTKISNNCK